MAITISTDLTQCDKKGSEGSLYYNTGTCATPVWVYHKGVTGDLSLNETENANQHSSRDPAQLVHQYTEDKIDVEISGTQFSDSGYEGCTFINSMRAGSSPRDVMILDGYITEVGSTGWRGYFRNFDRSKSMPEQGGMTQNFLLKPAACVTAACKVRPVQIATASTVTDYDPGTFVAAS